MAIADTKNEPFFLYYPWFIFLFVVLAFGGKALLAWDSLPPLTPMHHIHAVTMLAWFGLFALQPTLIHLKRPAIHRRLGRWSPLVVLLFFATSVPMTTVNWDRLGDPMIVTANVFNLLGFLAFYIAAILWRRSTAAHMRLMVYASLMLIGPAAARLPETFDQSPFWAAPIVLILHLAPVVHDMTVHRRVHPAVWIGFAVALLQVILIIGFSGSSAWISFIESVLGPSVMTG